MEEENAEGMVVLRAAALSGRWEELLEKMRQSFSRDRRIDFKWTSPDMRRVKGGRQGAAADAASHENEQFESQAA